MTSLGQRDHSVTSPLQRPDHTHGLTHVYLFPGWKRTTGKANVVLLAKNPKAEPCSGNSVLSIAECEVYAGNVVALRTHEGRELGKTLYQLEHQEPRLKIPVSMLFPGKDVISMADVLSTAASPYPASKKRPMIKKCEQRVAKLSVKVDGHELIITNRFGGELAKIFGLVKQMPGYSQQDGTLAAEHDGSERNFAKDSPSEDLNAEELFQTGRVQASIVVVSL